MNVKYTFSPTPTFLRAPFGSPGIFANVSEVILISLLELLVELEEVEVDVLLGGGDEVELELLGPVVLDEDEVELLLELEPDELTDELLEWLEE